MLSCQCEVSRSSPVKLLLQADVRFIRTISSNPEYESKRLQHRIIIVSLMRMRVKYTARVQGGGYPKSPRHATLRVSGVSVHTKTRFFKSLEPPQFAAGLQERNVQFRASHFLLLGFSSDDLRGTDSV
jgi:hypothetical protein